MCKTDKFVKHHLSQSVPYKMPLIEKRLLGIINSGSLSGYVQCDNQVPENLRECFANFPLICKNINVGWDDIGPFIKEYVKKEGLSTHPRRKLITSYFFENGAITTHCCSFIWTWDWFALKSIALCNKLQCSFSTILFSLQ